MLIFTHGYEEFQCLRVLYVIVLAVIDELEDLRA
jgi:hypothetical protein